jgi:transcriptional regulator with XRE-family HTH domain
MLPITCGSSVCRLLLGRRLRELRTGAGVHPEDAAIHAGIAQATLWRMEKGDRRCRYQLRHVDVLGRLYKADDRTLSVLAELAGGARAVGEVGEQELAQDVALVLELQRYARELRCYAGTLLPALLQTERYSTAVLAAQQPWGREGKALEVAGRELARLSALAEGGVPVAALFLIDETVLARPVGDAEVMAGQLGAIVRLGGLPGVTVRLVPSRAGVHPGLLTGTFTLLTFPDDGMVGSLPARVYADRPGGYAVPDEPTEVGDYERAWAGILGKALDEKTSMDLLREMAASWRP